MFGAAVALILGLASQDPATAAAVSSDRVHIALPASAPFIEMQRVAAWIAASNDNRGAPFMIVDKVNARLFLFDADATLRASTPVLVGLARGDDSPPGIGMRKLAAITPAERITPAGRFDAVAGEDFDGADLIWLDYDAAIAIHRASDRKPGMSSKSRAERLASATPAERRVSLGCINVSTDFYDRFLLSAFRTQKGVAYILPETRPAAAVFSMEI